MPALVSPREGSSTKVGQQRNRFCVQPAPVAGMEFANALRATRINSSMCPSGWTRVVARRRDFSISPVSIARPAPQRPVETGSIFVTNRKLTASCIIALALTWAAAAGAATYYVSPTGSATSSGTQAAPWTLAKANSSLIAGDVAILLPGSYTSSIAPVSSGSSYSRYVAYVGSLSNPASTSVAGISFATRSYVSVKGVQFGGTPNITTSRDSIGWCIGGLINFN